MRNVNLLYTVYNTAVLAFCFFSLKHGNLDPSHCTKRKHINNGINTEIETP